MKFRWMILYGLLIPSVSFPLAQGEEPPPLQISRWLQAPSGFTGEWGALRGKVVVLDFWATWCSPCIEAIPHLNQLADGFSDEDVVFLAISDDSAERVESFLTRQPISAFVGIDDNRASWKAFDVPSIPHTVVVNRDGRLIGATRPEAVTADVLREVLAGHRPHLPPKEGIPSDLSWDEHSIQWQDGVRPMMYAIIKPIKTTTAGYWRPRPNHLTADGAPLRALVQIAFQIDNLRLDWQMPNDDRTYRAAFRVPEARQDRLLSYMQQTLEDTFGIQARWEERLREVSVLRLIDHDVVLPESEAEEELIQMMRGQITLRRQPVSKLCELLTTSLQEIVIDETGLDGRYDFEIPYQPGQPDQTIRALEQIGFELVGARRSIPVLVVTQESGASL